MLIPKKDRVMIYEYLFKEGVLVAKKDPFAAKHPEIEVKNLHVMKALTVSNGFIIMHNFSKSGIIVKVFYYTLLNQNYFSLAWYFCSTLYSKSVSTL